MARQGSSNVTVFRWEIAGLVNGEVVSLTVPLSPALLGEARKGYKPTNDGENLERYVDWYSGRA
jgi:hypothetical protein